MSKFAENTSVSSEKSKAEIERTLQRYGAAQFVYGVDHDRGMAFIRFSMNGKQIKFVLPLPRPDAPEFTQSPAGRRRRKDDAAYRAWEQAIRQRWRALALVIKAKLEAVETGITCFEDEFLAHILLPSGETVGEWISPQIEQAYLSAKMPKLLPGLN